MLGEQRPDDVEAADQGQQAAEESTDQLPV
jgi:hypothetical protein